MMWWVWLLFIFTICSSTLYDACYVALFHINFHNCYYCRMDCWLWTLSLISEKVIFKIYVFVYHVLYDDIMLHASSLFNLILFSNNQQKITILFVCTFIIIIYYNINYHYLHLFHTYIYYIYYFIGWRNPSYLGYT